jgi:hypothetical protein
VGFYRGVLLSGWEKTKCSKGAKMTLQGLVDVSPFDRPRMMQALAQFRREWQGIANGESLVSVEAPVGLLLADITDWLEFTREERNAILGGKLISEVNAFMEQRPSPKSPD